MANITLPPVNTFVPTTRTADFAGAAATANLQTGFSAQNTFGAGQANFAALGSPDAAGSGLQQLTQVISALTQIVSALGQLVAALKGGGAESAAAKPDAGGAAGGTQPQTGTAAKQDPNQAAGGGGEQAATKPADGGAGGAAPAGGAQQANAGGGSATDFLSQLAPLLQTLTQLIQALEQQDAQKAEAGGKAGKKGGAGAKHTHASDSAKQHAAANSTVGQQAQMEKLNQAITQILTSLIQMLGPILQQLAGQMGKDNPAAAAAGQNLQTALQSGGGGGISGGVLAR